MKYMGIIDTNEFKNFEFLEDANGKFLIAKDKNATYDEWIPIYFKPFNLQEPKWITIKEKLPEVGIDVLVCDEEGVIYLSHRSSFGSFISEWGDKIKDIRAWMPLPEPYKEKEEED